MLLGDVSGLSLDVRVDVQAQTGEAQLQTKHLNSDLTFQFRRHRLMAKSFQRPCQREANGFAAKDQKEAPAGRHTAFTKVSLRKTNSFASHQQ